MKRARKKRVFLGTIFRLGVSFEKLANPRNGRAKAGHSPQLGRLRQASARVIAAMHSGSSGFEECFGWKVASHHV